MVFSEKADEGFELAGLLEEVAGGADEAGEFCLRQSFDGGGSEQVIPAQIGDCAFHIKPGCVLNEDGADDYFEGRLAGPPVLFAVSLKQRIKILREDGQGFGSWGAANRDAAAALTDGRAGGRRGGQSGARTHLIRTISMGWGQVKNGRGGGEGKRGRREEEEKEEGGVKPPLHQKESGPNRLRW